MADDLTISDAGVLVARRTGPVTSITLAMPPINPSLFVPIEAVRVASGQVVTISAGSFFVGVNFAPTIVYDNGLFSGGRTFQDAATYRNTPGQAKTQLHHTSFYASPVIIGDGALFTTDRSGFFDQPDYSIVNGGSISGTTRAAHESGMAIGAGVTITSRRGYRYLDAGGAGQLDFQVGIDIEALSKGTLNIGFRNASTEVATPSVQTLTAVGNTITPNAKVKRLDNTSGGSLTLTSNPHISDGQDGQILILFNSSANDVVLTDGNGVQLGAATRTLGTRDTLMLIYSTTIGDWIELGFVNN